MKSIDIDDDVYRYIAAQTEHIGESASDILRRLLNVPVSGQVASHEPAAVALSQPSGDIFSYLESLKPEAQKSRVERFLMILAALHRFHANEFAKLLELKGRNRVYFSTDKQALLATGSSTNPKQVPDTEYWVITNNNTNKKASMLQEVALTLGYDKQQALALSWILAPELKQGD